jgi:hypothetical protein
LEAVYSPCVSFARWVSAANEIKSSTRYVAAVTVASTQRGATAIGSRCQRALYRAFDCSLGPTRRFMIEMHDVLGASHLETH